MGNVHFAGDNISFATGWIEGALASGLKAAYQAYERHMEIGNSPKNEKHSHDSL